VASLIVDFEARHPAAAHLNYKIDGDSLTPGPIRGWKSDSAAL